MEFFCIKVMTIIPGVRVIGIQIGSGIYIREILNAIGFQYALIYKFW